MPQVEGGKISEVGERLSPTHLPLRCKPDGLCLTIPRGENLWGGASEENLLVGKRRKGEGFQEEYENNNEKQARLREKFETTRGQRKNRGGKRHRIERVGAIEIW